MTRPLPSDPYEPGAGVADIALLVNPTAGHGRGARWVEPVAGRLRSLGRTVDVVTGATAAESLRLAHDVVDRGVGVLVALGGDGVVHLAVQAVAGRPVTLGIVAAGTGNDFARALGLPRDPLAAADVIAAAHVRPVDAVTVGGPGIDAWFAGVLATGFDSQVNERANRMRGRAGRGRYTLAMLAELRTLRPAAYGLVIDGELLDTDAVLVAVANTTSYGAGMRIAPDASPTDGLLDVTIVGPVTRRELLRVFPRVYTGSFVSHSAVRRLRGRTVEVSSAEGIAYADGERIGALPITACVVPGALQVAVPAPGAAPLR